MDHAYLSWLVGRFLETLIPVGVGVLGVWAVSLSPLGRAISEKIRSSIQHAGQSAGLPEEVAALQHQVTEMQERLDFAERVLADVRSGPANLDSPSRAGSISRDRPVVTPS